MSAAANVKNIAATIGLALIVALMPVYAQAAAAPVLTPSRLNILAFAVCAGLCLRKVGHVRSHHALQADMQCFAVFVVCCIAFWALGFDLLRSVNSKSALIRGVVGGFSLGGWYPGSARSMLIELAAAAITGQVVIGTLAERIRLVPLLIFLAVLAGVVFPIAASWQWGGGWLAGAGFVDFAGATVIHSVAGWAALAGAIVVGARPGRFARDGEPHGMGNHSGLLMVLGSLVLWLGWQGLVGGLRAGTPMPPSSTTLAHVLTVTNVAAVSGLIAATAASALVPRWFTVDATLNGLIAGLVAISADPIHATILWSIVVGVGAGLIVAYAPILLYRLRLDDVTGSIPAHLGAGIWGTLVAAFSAPGANLAIQLLGVLAVGAGAFIVSFVLLVILQLLFGLRSISGGPISTGHAASGRPAS